MSRDLFLGSFVVAKPTPRTVPVCILFFARVLPQLLAWMSNLHTKIFKCVRTDSDWDCHVKLYFHDNAFNTKSASRFDVIRGLTPEQWAQRLFFILLWIAWPTNQACHSLYVSHTQCARPYYCDGNYPLNRVKFFRTLEYVWQSYLNAHIGSLGSLLKLYFFLCNKVERQYAFCWYSFAGDVIRHFTVGTNQFRLMN